MPRLCGRGHAWEGHGVEAVVSGPAAAGAGAGAGGLFAAAVTVVSAGGPTGPCWAEATTVPWFLAGGAAFGADRRLAVVAESFEIRSGVKNQAAIRATPTAQPMISTPGRRDGRCRDRSISSMSSSRIIASSPPRRETQKATVTWPYYPTCCLSFSATLGAK